MKRLQHPQIITPSLYLNPIFEKDIKKYLVKIKRGSPSIVFFGSDSFVTSVLEALEENFDVCATVTAPDSAVANCFKGLSFTPNKLDEEFELQLSTLNPDLFIVASYGKILPSTLLKVPKFGALNVHPSLLPKYRGPSPIPATILNGDKVTGVTIIKMDKEMDHGSIVATRKISLTGQEIFPELINKLFQLGADLLVKIIPDFVSGKIKSKRQNHAKASFCQFIRKKDGYFDLPAGRQVSAEFLKELDRMIRAYYPWPGVWTRWHDRIVKFLPGGLIQMEGKKAISWKDFLNGYPDFPIKSITLDKK